MSTVEKVEVSTPHEYGAYLSQYRNSGYVVSSPLGLEVTRLTLAKRFNGLLFFFGLILGVLPGILYLLWYWFIKDNHYVELRLTNSAAQPPSSDRGGAPFGGMYPPREDSAYVPGRPEFPNVPWPGPSLRPPNRT